MKGYRGWPQPGAAAGTVLGSYYTWRRAEGLVTVTVENNFQTAGTEEYGCKDRALTERRSTWRSNA
jgi:hypothetical protein